MRKYLLFQVVISLFLSACVTTPAPDDGVHQTGPDLNYRGSDCILIRSVRDYTPLDNQHLLIRGPGRRAYFVTLFRPTFEMRGSFSLRFDSRDDQLCPFGGDAIVFGSFGDDRVPVQSISRLSADQEEQILIRYGKKELPESETPAEPVEVKPARVEELG